VIEKAQRLFWKDGAAGVTLDSLSRATGLHKPSLYAAFGGKAGLYSAALDSYIDRGAPDVRGALDRAPLGDALEAFFEADLDVFCAGGEGRGCFLVGTAIQAAGEAPDIGSKVEAVFASLRRLIRGRLERAIVEGDLDSASDLEGMTEILFGTHVALSVEARSGAPRAELRKHYRRVLDFLA
jgi:AcrR family transcriptional regulator